MGDLEPGDEIVLDRSRLVEALESLPAETEGVLERVAGRIRSFAQAQRDSLEDLDLEVTGGRAGHRWIPVTSTGAYAPGGRYPLPSSVLMTVIPGRVAGVDIGLGRLPPADTGHGRRGRDRRGRWASGGGRCPSDLRPRLRHRSPRHATWSSGRATVG